MTTSWIAKQDLQRCCLLGSFHRKSFLLCHGYMGAFGSTSSCTDLTMKPRQSGLPPPNSFPPQQNLQLVSTARTSNFVFKNTFTSRRTIISFVYAHRYIRHEIPCLAWSLTWGRVILCEWNLEMHFYFDLISIYRVRNVSLFTVGYMHTHEDDQQWLNVCTQGKKRKYGLHRFFIPHWSPSCRHSTCRGHATKHVQAYKFTVLHSRFWIRNWSDFRERDMTNKHSIT